MTNHTRQPAGVPTGGQFAASAKTEAGVVLDGATLSPPPFEVEQADPTTIKPGDQVLVRGATDVWAEVGTVDGTVTPPIPNAPWTHIARCTSGYNRGMTAGEPVDVIRGDEDGIPALSPTIWAEKMDAAYDSGTPTYVAWCDFCGTHQGHSTSDDPGPTRELCHGCEDLKIGNVGLNGYGA